MVFNLQIVPSIALLLTRCSLYEWFPRSASLAYVEMFRPTLPCQHFAPMSACLRACHSHCLYTFAYACSCVCVAKKPVYVGSPISWSSIHLSILSLRAFSMTRRLYPSNPLSFIINSCFPGCVLLVLATRTGKVVYGFQRGSKLLGYPTANLDPQAFKKDMAGVPRGVYIGWYVY
jgi:hypothetical protein